MAKKIIIPYLPKQKGIVGEELDKGGEWTNIPGLIASLSRDLDVEGEATKDLLTAIPNVWARPMLFGEALSNNKHPLHHEVVREWRGLLGIFCFKQVFNFKIEFKPVEIDPNHSRFASILNTSKPDEGWKKISLIYVEDALIGGTCPESLFFTPPEYRLPHSISWKTEKGVLGDPAEYFKTQGMSRELSILKKWIRKLDPEERDARFVEWIEDIDKEDIRLPDVGDFELREISDEVDLPYYDFAQYADVEKTGEGDFYLKSSKQPQEDVIVIWKEGWKDENRTVHGAIKVKNVKQVLDLLDDKKSIRSIFEARNITGEPLIPEIDFFTDRAIRMPLNEEAAFCSGDCGLLPPLKEEILRYFYGEEIGKMLRWEERSDGMLAILSLPLEADTKGRARRAEIRRLYKSEDIIKEVEKDPPVVAVWPNFYAQDWQWYYMITEKKPAYKIRFSPITETSLKGGGKQEDEGNERDRHMIWQSRQAIEGVECRHEERPVGLLLPKVDKAKDIGDEEWHVAVDFGTSNTTVCVKSGRTGEPQVLKFNDRALKLTEATDPIDFLSAWFMPFLEDGSLTSVFRVLISKVMEVSKPVSDGIILHVDTNPAWPTLSLAPEVKSGLKWSMDEKRERRLMITFLQHLLLLIAAESRFRGISKLTFYSSFPSAFLKKWQEDLKNNWGANILPILQGSGWRISLDADRNFETESVAVCKYLRKKLSGAQEIGLRMPVCVVDIGGGTTDIGVWIRSENKTEPILIAQASVLCAGGVVSDHALASEDFWKTLYGAASKVSMFQTDFAKMRKSSAARTLVPTAINTILKTHGKSISGKVIEEGPTDFLEARSIIAFAYGALFYYTGLILRLITKDRPVVGCSVHLAGNGAKLLEWVGNFPSVFKSLTEIVYASAEFDDLDIKKRIFIRQPEHPKEEVARGLLAEAVFDSSVPPIKIIGETGYTYKEADLEWFRDMVKEKEIFSVNNINQLRVPDKFPELEAYIKVYNKEAGKLGVETLEDYDAAVIQNDIDARLNSIAAGSVDGELLQPLFVEEVKSVIRKYFLLT